MRKFTKEISALLASVAIGTTACAGTVAASSDELEPPTAGITMEEYETVYNTPTEEELPPLEGEAVPPDEWTEPTTEEPLLAGGLAILDEDVTEPTEELPPVDGGFTLPDEDVTEPTEELPPLAGDIALPDGDIDGNGALDIMDVIQLQKWLLAAPDIHLDNWWAADLCMDGSIDVFDLNLMKRKLIE